MNKKILFALWGGFYVLCAALGFIPEPTGALRILLITFSVAFFLPPLLLIRTGDKTLLRLIRNLALIWLLLTTALIIANFLSFNASLRLGNVLYALLVIISSPMICGQYWVLSLFGWSWLMFDCISKLRRK
jgi:hypothetical protein